jgi:hypothetical protein
VGEWGVGESMRGKGWKVGMVNLIFVLKENDCIFKSGGM